MTYKLVFHKTALKEWNKLNTTIQSHFKKKLKKIVENPHIKANKLSSVGLENCYKIKLRSDGFRLVYEVDDGEIKVKVISVGKRERNLVYKTAIKRLLGEIGDTLKDKEWDDKNE